MTRLDRLLHPADVAVLGHQSLEEYILQRCLHSGQAVQDHFKQQVDAAVLLCSAPTSTSALQLSGQSACLQSLPTGCRTLDKLLDGEGLRPGCVLELAGPSATGKTQLCHCCAATTAARGDGVVWIDTTNAFSPQRVCQLADGARSSSPSPSPLDNIQVYKPHSIHQLLHVLNQLITAFSQNTLPGPGPKLLIIDSVSAIISPVLGNPQHSQGHTLLVAVARAIKYLAATWSLAVVLTNHVTAARRDDRHEVQGASGVLEDMVPALGEAWRPQPHFRVQLHLPSDPEGVREAMLVLSCDKAVGERGYFQILPSGIVDVIV